DHGYAEALVPHASRLRIGKSNFRLRSDITSKESTLQVVYDVLRLTPFYKMNNKKRIINLEYFREMLHICPRIPNQTFDELPFKEEILAFLRYFGHSGEIKKITDNTQQFGVILPVELTNEDIRNYATYKEYYAIASAGAPPKTKASVRKTQSSSDTTITPPTATGIRLSTSEKGKQHAKSSKVKGLSVLSEVAMTEAEQIKLATKRSLQQTYISQASGSGADEGTGILPGVLDVPADESDKEISWKSSDEDDDEVDDRNNDGDDLVHPKFSTHDEEAKDEESFDPIVQTPFQEEKSDDEGNDDVSLCMNVGGDEGPDAEDDDELYGDLNINLEGVKSYQKKLNLTKPDTYMSDLKRKEAYTAYSNLRGFIYQNKDKQNRLMRIDELHKFSDGTLNDVQTTLDDRLKGIQIKYLPQTIWRKSDKERATTMIQAIDKQLKTRWIMRSLEKFVGGRLYEGDFRITLTKDGNHVKKILLKLNLSDHRKLKDGGKGFSAQSIRSSNAIALDSPNLLVLITETSQSRQHVDTSLIHLESRKSPTAELLDVDSGRISIHHCRSSRIHSDEVLKLKNFKKDASKSSQVIKSRKYHKIADCYDISSQSDYSSDGCEDNILECKFDESGKGVIICLYVDDMLIFGTDQVHVDLTKKFLSSKFSIKVMGEADVILGIRIKDESNRIAISQSHHIQKVLKKFNYFDCTPVSTPMDTSEKLIPSNGHVVPQLEYSRVIGCLMYDMTCTRHDISFAVGKLILEGYTDAIWISNTKDNLSTSGWVFPLDGAAGKEPEWLRNLILETPLWSKPIAPISIRCDSAATLAKAYNQMYNRKSRHLCVEHNMIREPVINGGGVYRVCEGSTKLS
nr:hypothetical protein [Tanacetum cinerariifolium]